MQEEMAHFEIVTNRVLKATADRLLVTVWKCQNVRVMNIALITAIWIC